MKEVKILEQRARKLQTEVDQQDADTLEMLQNEMKVEIYLHRDEESDEPIINADKSVSYVRTINLNGIQWQIPVQVKTEIPKTIYEIIHKAECLKQALKPKPMNFTRVDLGQDHLFINQSPIF